MLQPIYKRDLNHNYLILQGNETEETYEIKMVLENEMEGLLKTEARFVNGRVDYYYEISSKQPMSRLFSKAEISYEQLKQLLLGINQLMSKAKEYLLPFEHFVLNRSLFIVIRIYFRFIFYLIHSIASLWKKPF